MMSGVVELFQRVASWMMRVLSVGFVRSAGMEWKRWVCGFAAQALMGRLEECGALHGNVTNRDLGFGGFQLRFRARDDDDVGALFCEEFCDCFAHTLGGSSDYNRLDGTYQLCIQTPERHTSPTFPLTGNLSRLNMASSTANHATPINIKVGRKYMIKIGNNCK